ncbi:TRAP transporter small permease subunit [Thalassospira sp.]|uniref:TRAP transporter small permease subunit n=1 Tax=Thalassospira sp. TaxID=1912094 RepID=UPI0027371C95|nr:TRAP transporter small permease subunit [Thalassospira sp.]MDP2696908.1 TRAP transporter small permease subunit [Thalassospira sp.]
MFPSFFGAMDRLAGFFSQIARLVAVGLVVSMIYEVAARYVFNAPTLWAFDIAYMCTGVLFILGAAQALKEDAHVRIDFLSMRFPKRLAQLIEGTVFVVVLFPIFSGLSWIGIRRAFRAWERGEVEMVSPWAPLMWPFYSLLAIGLVILSLQILVEGLRAYGGKGRLQSQVEI